MAWSIRPGRAASAGSKISGRLVVSTNNRSEGRLGLAQQLFDGQVEVGPLVDGEGLLQHRQRGGIDLEVPAQAGQEGEPRWAARGVGPGGVSGGECGP